MITLLVILGGLVIGVIGFSIDDYLYDRRFLKEFQRSRTRPRTPEDIFIDMRERKHDTMRRMREVAKDYHRREGR
ncbi:hypothetical protein [Streptomyces sp. T028]|uniref:hypothetical protein n=1 Tax=Streptomyces sp. T028 TaxID=3394379 RepID=UPI003A87E4C3